MEHAIEVLTKAESVLNRRIQRMRPGKPQTAAQYRINELRKAIVQLKRIGNEKESA
jgi:hypothetical protein